MPQKKWTNVPKHDSHDVLLPGCAASSCFLPPPESFFQPSGREKEPPLQGHRPAGVPCCLGFHAFVFHLVSSSSVLPLLLFLSRAYRHIFPTRVKTGSHSRGTSPRTPSDTKITAFALESILKRQHLFYGFLQQSHN